MRSTLIAAGVIALAAPALAEPWGLMGEPVECAALESLVVFGLIDGGIGGDTTELTDVVMSGDGQVCLAWLDNYGLGDGMRLDTCQEAFSILAANGLPEWLAGSEPDFIRDILTPQYDAACEEMLFDLTAGQ